jgi:hypothetical protein
MKSSAYQQKTSPNIWRPDWSRGNREKIIRVGRTTLIELKIKNPFGVELQNTMSGTSNGMSGASEGTSGGNACSFSCQTGCGSGKIN